MSKPLEDICSFTLQLSFEKYVHVFVPEKLNNYKEIRSIK